MGSLSLSLNPIGDRKTDTIMGVRNTGIRPGTLTFTSFFAMKWPLLVLSHNNNNCSSSKSPNGGFFFGNLANFFFTNTSHSFSFPTFLSDISSFNVAWTGGRAPSRPHESFRVQDTKVGCDIAKQEGGKVSDSPSTVVHPDETQMDLRSKDTTMGTTLNKAHGTDTFLHILITAGETGHTVVTQGLIGRCTQLGGPDQTAIATNAGNLAAFALVAVASAAAST